MQQIGQQALGPRSGFTLIEILLVIAIIAIIIAILLPVFVQRREKSRQSSCLSNLKQLSMAVSLYTHDYDDTLPMGGWRHGTPGPQGRWYRDIFPYVKNLEVFACPSRWDASGAWTPILSGPDDNFLDRGPNSPGGYGINYNLVGYPYGRDATGQQAPSPSKTLAQIADSSATFLLAEGGDLSGVAGNDKPATWADFEIRATDWQVAPPTDFTGGHSERYQTDSVDYNRRPVPRHNGGLNIGYCDGHAAWNRIEYFLGPMNFSAGQFGWPYGHPRNSWDDH